MHRGLVLLPALPLLLGATRAEAQEPAARWNLRAELGAEYDSNARRDEQVEGTPGPPIVGSPLGRLVLGGGLVARPLARTDVSLSASLAGKRFGASTAQPEDVGVAQASAVVRYGLGETTWLGAATGYYEAFQRAGDDGRDFRSVAPMLRLTQAFGQGSATLAAGHRWFTFKPDPDFDFRAPVAALEYRHLLAAAVEGEDSAEWDVGVTGSIELRAFEGPALARSTTGPGCTDATIATARADRFLTAGAEAVRVGAVLLAGGYLLSRNTSTSCGEGLLRHAVYLRAVGELPAGLYLAARVELLFTSYDDAVQLAAAPPGGQQKTSIEDETRNSLRLELTRDVGERWQAVARYTFYTNELGTDVVRFRRHLVMAGLAFVIDD